jgi:hypothetical protein
VQQQGQSAFSMAVRQEVGAHLDQEVTRKPGETSLEEKRFLVKSPWAKSAIKAGFSLLSKLTGLVSRHENALPAAKTPTAQKFGHPQLWPKYAPP